MEGAGGNDCVSNIVFQRTVSEQFSAELAIGPALAFVVTQTPSSGYRKTLLTVAMVVLIFSSILRFLAFTDRFADADRIARLTVRPLQISAIVCFVQIVQFAAIEVSPFIPAVEMIGLSILITVLGTLMYILAFESVFETYRFSWGVLYYAKVIAITRSVGINLSDADAVLSAIESEGSLVESMKTAVSLFLIQVLRAVYVSVSYFLLRDSIPDGENDVYIRELQRWVNVHGEQKPISDRASIGFAFIISAVVVVPVYFVLSWTLSWLLGPLTAILGSLVVMRLLQHLVNVSYISFGGMRYDQILTTNARAVSLDTLYTLIVWIMLVLLPFG